MDNFLQVLTMAGIALNAALLVRWHHRREWEQAPGAFWFVAVLLFSSAAKWLVWYAKLFTPADYAHLYWKCQSLEVAFACAAIGEQLEHRRFGIACGITLGTCLWLRGDIPAFGWAAVALSLAAVLGCVHRRVSLFCCGLTVYWLFLAILYQPHVPYWTRGIPVFTWVITLVLWFLSPRLSPDSSPSL